MKVANSFGNLLFSRFHQLNVDFKVFFSLWLWRKVGEKFEHCFMEKNAIRKLSVSIVIEMILIETFE